VACRVAILLLLAASPLVAADPQIEKLSATAANGRVSVHFTLTGVFGNGEITEALGSGLPTTFTYVVELFRDRPNWFDEGVSRTRLEVIATFNSVTREYLVNYRRDRKLVRSETVTDLAALEQRMTRIDERDLFDIGDRKPYKLKVRVKSDFARYWKWYIMPWQVSTGWRETRVRTAEPPS
jgi:hypothetical protein